jgi:hypothetical protein
MYKKIRRVLNVMGYMICVDDANLSDQNINYYCGSTALCWALDALSVF